MTLKTNKNFEDAEITHKKAIQYSIDNMGPENVNTALTTAALALLYNTFDKKEKALEVFEQARKIFELPKNIPLVIDQYIEMLVELSHTNMQLKKFTDATQCLSVALYLIQKKKKK